MRVSRIFLILFSIVFSFNAFGYELKISTDKSTLVNGEAFYLTISYDGRSEKNPDLQSLENDFKIVSNSVSRSINIVNGNVSQSKQWRIGLVPFNEGKIRIKPIRLDNLISNHLDIEVKETTDTAYIEDSIHNSNAPFIQINQISDNKSPYIQQQVTFLVTLYDSIGLRIKNISINNESSSDWLITPLSDTPILSKDVVNGKKVNVVQYAYAGFPQKSGKINEPRFIIEGYYLKNNELSIPYFEDAFDLFGFGNVFGKQVHVKMQTNESFSNIKPIPSNYTGRHWIPVSNLTLSSDLKNIDNLRQGDAFNQVVTVTATGLHETMFPNLKFKPIDNVKSYPEKPQTSSKTSNGMLETTAVINNVYIPNESGKITIPSFEVDWFNVNTNKMEKSVVPSQIIIANNNPNISTQQAIPNKNLDDVSKNNLNNNESKEKTNTLEKIKTKSLQKLKNIEFKKYLHHFIFLASSILLILLFKIINYKNRYRNSVIRAIKRRNYKKAKDYLIIWAKVKFSDSSIKNTTDISEMVNNEEFSKQLSILNKVIYSETNEILNNTKFIEIFKNIDKIKYRKRINKNPIPQLYD